jgi:hypothetical protein
MTNVTPKSLAWNEETTISLEFRNLQNVFYVNSSLQSTLKLVLLRKDFYKYKKKKSKKGWILLAYNIINNH